MNADAVHAAVDGAVGKLLRHVGRDGGVNRPCGSRAIESALTLHLLHDVPFHRRAAERLRSYCLAFWESRHEKAAVHPLAEIDHVVSCALIAAALDLPEKRDLGEKLRERLTGFSHPSRDRKLHLFGVLLAELDPGMRSGSELPSGRVRSPSDQKWTRLLATASQVIDGIARASTDRVRLDVLEELSRSQLEDGSWECHILLTVTTLIALKKAGRHPGAVDRGIAFLMRQMRADGGIPFVPDVDIWLTALSGYALSGLRHLRPQVERMASYVWRHQLASGGWAFTPGIETADADDTGMCVLFLGKFAPSAYAGAIAGARQALLGFRNADGGFTTYVTGAASEAEITARAVMVLAQQADQYRPEIDAAIRWLEANQASDGTFRLEWTLCRTFPIAQVLWAIASLPPRCRRADEIRDRSVGHLLSTQNRDGGWGLVVGAESRVLPTAYALIGLGRAQQGTTVDAITRAIEYLVSQQLADGGFESPSDALGPRPFLFEMDLFPTVYALLALSLVDATLRRAVYAPQRPAPRAITRTANRIL